MRHVFRLLVFAAVSLAIGCLALLAYGWWFERPALRYEALPWPPTLKQVRPGEVIPLRVRRCNDSDQVIAYVVTHQLQAIDGPARFVMEPRTTTIEAGACETVTSEINQVPAGTPPGHYRVVGAGIVQGSLRTFVVPWHSAPFEVTP
jgi:hypothetical protein